MQTGVYNIEKNTAVFFLSSITGKKSSVYLLKIQPNRKVIFMLPNEKLFKAEKEIHYVLRKAEGFCDYLAIIFSGFNRFGLKEQHPYNYLNIMSNFNIHQLFIQDTCGSRGCYYLCEKMNFSVERTVKKLIDNVLEDLNIQYKNVITIGSSKGGTAALYFGLKYNFGYVVSGVPQTKIISYLKKCLIGGGGQVVINDLLGADYSEKEASQLDNLILNAIPYRSRTKVNLLLSQNDASWDSDFIPLIKELAAKKIKYDITDELRMKSHGDIGHFFPQYIKEKLFKIIINKKLNVPTVIEDLEGNIRIKPQWGRWFWRYEIQSSLDDIQKITKRGKYTFSPINLEAEAIEFKLTAVYPTNDRTWFFKEVICDSIIPKLTFELKGYECDYTNGKLIFRLNTVSEMDLLYAFYLFEGNERKEIIWYSPQNMCTFEVDKNKVYRISYFIKFPSGKIIRRTSEKIVYISD